MYIETFTFLPTGQIYSYGEYDQERTFSQANEIFSEFISIDSKRVKTEINSPVGVLEFIWTGSHDAGVSTLARNGNTVNSAVHLPGHNPKEENYILNDFIDMWRHSELIKHTGPMEPFFEAFSISHRPFMCSINWGGLKRAQYKQISKYDLYICSAYFEKLQRQLSLLEL